MTAPDFAAILYEDQLAAKVPELCQTCDGKGTITSTESGHHPFSCPYCPTIARLLAIGAAVMTANPEGTYPCNCVGGYIERGLRAPECEYHAVLEFIDDMRAVQP